MENVIAFETGDNRASSLRFSDPIISTEHVKWAARRFILIYGDEAPEMALRQVTRLDGEGKICVAEMFDRIRMECARLLMRSEYLRINPIN